MSHREKEHDPDLIESLRALCSELRPEPTGRRPELRPIPGIRAALFDIYGTLLVSSSGDVGSLLPGGAPDAAEAALLAAGAHGELARAAAAVPDLLKREILASHDASKARGIEYPEVEIREIWAAVLQTLRRQGLLMETPPPAAVERLAADYECRVNKVWPMPGLREILQDLAESGQSLGIVSNAQFYTPLIFEAVTGLTPNAAGFEEDLCVWSYLVGEAKPSPALFDPIARTLHRRGIRPAEAVYIGNDMLNDVTAAAHAGLRTVLFAGDRRSLRMREDDPRCVGVVPDVVITELDQLRQILIPQGSGK